MTLRDSKSRASSGRRSFPLVSGAAVTCEVKVFLLDVERQLDAGPEKEGRYADLTTGRLRSVNSLPRK